MNKKPQVSMEFILLVSFMMGIVVLSTLLILSKQKEINDQKFFLTIIDISSKIQKEFLIAHAASEGYNREFELPAKLGDVDYLIIENPDNKITTIRTENPQYDYVLPLPKYYGSKIEPGKKYIISKIKHPDDKTNVVIWLTEVE